MGPALQAVSSGSPCKRIRHRVVEAGRRGSAVVAGGLRKILSVTGDLARQRIRQLSDGIYPSIVTCRKRAPPVDQVSRPTDQGGVASPIGSTLSWSTPWAAVSATGASSRPCAPAASATSTAPKAVARVRCGAT